MLIAVSKRLQACLRPEDTVARLGGDEFTVLLESIADLEAAALVADRITQALQAPILLGGYSEFGTTGFLGHEVFINSSIGVAMQNHLHEQPDDLLRNADAAMYAAKTTRY